MDTTNKTVSKCREEEQTELRGEPEKLDITGEKKKKQHLCFQEHEGKEIGRNKSFV